MSWLLNSIANSLKLDDEEDDNDSDPKPSNSAKPSAPENPNDVDNQKLHSPPMESDQSALLGRGVKDDLSELSQTLTRQFWGVASFLAPPPPQISDRDPQSHDSEPNSGDAAGISGIRNDLSEIGGKFRTGISKLSSNKAVSEFTKIASNLLQFGAEDLTLEEYAQRGVVGVTEEVVAFARDVALHPETWLDFPLPDDEDDEDFDLSDAQQEHALAVERLVPELAALRSEICLGYMSESSFWKIYFVLVHPRLSKHDALVLSTPEIVTARAMLSQELRNRGKSMPHESRGINTSADSTQLSHEEHLSVPAIDQSESVPVETSGVEPASSTGDLWEMDKHPVTYTEIPIVDKTVIEEVSTKPTNKEQVSTKQKNNEEVSTKQANIDDVAANNLTNNKEVSAKQTDTEGVSTKQTSVQKPAGGPSKSAGEKDDDDADDWLQEEVENTEAPSVKGNSYPLDNDEDISFSDLEEDD